MQAGAWLHLGSEGGRTGAEARRPEQRGRACASCIAGRVARGAIRLAARALLAAFVLAGPAEAAVQASPTVLGLVPETASQMVFLRDSNRRVLHLTSVDVETLTGPGGTVLPSSAVRARLSQPRTAQRVPVELTIMDRSVFNRPGEYRIGLAVVGQASPRTGAAELFDQLVELTLSREAAAVEVGSLENAVIPIARSWPGGSGSFSLDFAVTATKGGDIDSVGLSVAPVVGAETREAAGGSVMLASGGRCPPSGSAPAPAGTGAPSSMGLASGVGQATLCFADFGRAGRFQTDLTFLSPRLEEAKLVSIKITVKDRWFWPFAVILLGVVAGAIVHCLAGPWQRRQLTRIRLLEQQRRLEGIAVAVAAIGATRRTYNGLLERLTALLARSEIEADLESAVAQLQADIATFETELATREQQALEKLDTLKSQLAEVSADLRSVKGTDPTQHFAAFRSQLQEAESLLHSGHVEEGADTVEKACERFNELRRMLIAEVLKKIRMDLSRLNDAARADFDKRLKDAEQLPDDPERKIGTILRTLAHDVEAARPRAAAARHASIPTGETAVLPSRIVVDVPAEQRISGQMLTFTVEPRQAIPITEVKWQFGNVIYRTKQPVRSHQFFAAGRYTVRVRVTYANGWQEPLDLPIRILQSETESALRKAIGAIRRANWVIFVVAVVVATATGMLQLYVDEPFGTVRNYFTAFIWGFGIDAATRGFSATLAGLRAGS